MDNNMEVDDPALSEEATQKVVVPEVEPEQTTAANCNNDEDKNKNEEVVDKTPEPEVGDEGILIKMTEAVETAVGEGSESVVFIVPVVEKSTGEDQIKILEILERDEEEEEDPNVESKKVEEAETQVVADVEQKAEERDEDKVEQIVGDLAKVMDTDESPIVIQSVVGAIDDDKIKILEVIKNAVIIDAENPVEMDVDEKSAEEVKLVEQEDAVVTTVLPTKAVELTIDDDGPSFVCLVCNTSVPLPPDGKQRSEETVNIDYVTLSSIYRVEVTTDEFDQDVQEIKGTETFSQNQFCKTCLIEIEQLMTFHTSMKMAVSKFESQRDMIASRMFQTFLLNQDVIKQPVPPAKTGYQQEVLEKWKGMYTGKEDRENEVLRMVKERESRAAKISKRIAKVKSSLRRTGTYKPVAGNQPAKTLAQIQRAMTAAYFTPKLTILKKKNKHFLKIPLVYKADRSAQYVCPICDKVFAKKESMTIHTRSHVVSSGKLYKCSICDKICSDRQKLINHRKEHTEDQKNMKCAFCDKTFFRKGTLRNHLRTQHQKENFNCTICDKKFISALLLKKHVASHSNIDFSVTDMFTCRTCSKSFLKSSDLNNHLRVHEDDNIQGCDFCGKAFDDEASLDAHKVIHEGGNPYICESDDCGQRFASEALLNSHLKIHRPKDFTCEQCGKACRSRDGLRKHELTHTGKKPFNCVICDLGFIERKSYDAHMVKHTGKLPYQCNICKSDEGFKDAKDTRRHKVEQHPETLPKDKTFACEFCWHGFVSSEAVSDHVAKVHERYKCHLCNRVFKLGDHLRRHMYIHTGEKPYPCTLCTKTFNQESNLKEHMYRHTGIRPHRCPYCPEIGYLRRMHLKDHMVKEHGTDKVPSLPMGRAAHNARRSEKRNAILDGQQQETILGDIYSTSAETVSVLQPQPEVIVPGIGGSSVYLKNLNLGNANVQKANQGPLIMRTVSTAGMANKAGQSPVFVRRIAQPGLQATTLKQDIPTINIKSETNLRFQTVMDAGDPNQQYIILL